MGRLNQEHWPDGKTIAPPIPLCSPDANASATQRPVHCCLGHIVRTGGKLLSQVTYMARFLWDDVDNFLFDELGSQCEAKSVYRIKNTQTNLFWFEQVGV